MTHPPPAGRARAWLARSAGLALAACAFTGVAAPNPAAAPAPTPQMTASAPAAGPHALPWDAQAEVPRLVWRSALDRARPATDAPRTPWREANDRVRRVGGGRSDAGAPAEVDPAAGSGAVAAPAASAAASSPAAAPRAAPPTHGM